MACKDKHRKHARELHKTVDRVDHSTSKPDQCNQLHYKRWIYQSIPMTHGYWERKIIDLGCDVGHTFSSVKKDNITQVDFVDREGIPNFVKADLEEVLPFDDNSFDIVVISEVLEHVENPEFSLSEAIRISNDKILVSIPYEFGWSDDSKPFTHGEHIHYFTYDSYRKLIEDTGLRNDGILEAYAGERMSWLCTTLYKEAK